MPSCCFAINCNHGVTGEKKCRLFRFPRDEATFKIWLAASRRSDAEPKFHSRLCSCHFVDGDKKNTPTIFDETNDFNRIKRRKLIEIPKMEGSPTSNDSFGPNSLTNSKESVEPEDDSKEGIMLEGVNKNVVLLHDTKLCLDLFDESKDCNDSLDDSDESQESIQETESITVISEDSQEPIPEEEPVIHDSWSLQALDETSMEMPGLSESSELKRLEDQLWEAQQRIVNLESELALEKVKCRSKEIPGNVLTYASLKPNFKIFHYYTGLPNFNAFELLVEWLSNTKFSYSEKWYARRVKTENQLLLTLLKLRLNPDYTDLAVRFQICVAAARDIFITVLDVLHSILFPLLKLPSTNDSLPVTLTLAFRKYSCCRCVVDCIEIPCDRARKVSDRVKDPQQKGPSALKALIACTPWGSIAYVGNLFLESATDKELFEADGFLKNFFEGDIILANKKFSVDEILPPKVLMEPPSYFKDKEQDVDSTCPRTRIPSDTVLCRMRNYKILEYIPHHMKQHASKVLQLVACLVDLHPPLGQKEVEVDISATSEDNLAADMHVS